MTSVTQQPTVASVAGLTVALAGKAAADPIGSVGFTSHKVCDLAAGKWALFQGGFYGGPGCFALANDCGFQWWSGGTYSSGTVDTGWHRSAAGVLEANNGTPGTIRDVKVRNLLDKDGAQVLTTRQAAVTDVAATDATAAVEPDASDLATAIALVNELKGIVNALVTLANEDKAQLNAALAKLRTHGLIAT